MPLFDFGEVRVREAEQTYRQAVNRLAAKAVNVRSEARDAYRAYRAAYDIAPHYQREVLPLRKIISDETLLRYNAMQIDVVRAAGGSARAYRVRRSPPSKRSAISGSPTSISPPPSSAAVRQARTERTR